MLQLVKSYPLYLEDKVYSVLLWYISVAPKDAVTKVEPTVRFPGMVGQAGLDIVVTCSLNGGMNGRAWLHAAPEGGEKLCNWYSQQGMQRLSQEHSLRSPTRRNDGRYFFFDEDNAILLSQRFDLRRVPCL